MFMIGIAIGIVIGWNWPQPRFARELQDRVVFRIKSLIERI